MIRQYENENVENYTKIDIKQILTQVTKEAIKWCKKEKQKQNIV